MAEFGGLNEVHQIICYAVYRIDMKKRNEPIEKIKSKVI